MCCRTLGNSTGLSFPSMAAGSRPSPPYLNCTINPSELRTVRSYWEQRSSRDCKEYTVWVVYEPIGRMEGLPLPVSSACIQFLLFLLQYPPSLWEKLHHHNMYRFTLQGFFYLLSLQLCGRRTQWEWVQSRNCSWQTLWLPVPWLNDNHRDRWNNLPAKLLHCQLNVSIHFFGKWGRALSSNPSGILFPLMACCPTHAIICEMLMKEPLDPQRAMVSGLLVRWSSCLHDFPADSLITDSSWRTTDYRSTISNHHNCKYLLHAHIFLFT